MDSLGQYMYAKAVKKAGTSARAPRRTNGEKHAQIRSEHHGIRGHFHTVLRRIRADRIRPRIITPAGPGDP